MYEIEKDVPMPDSHVNRKYPFHAMEVGDSFLALCGMDDRESLKKLQNSICASARRKRFHPKKFMTRTMDGGVRCWRKA